MSEFRSALPLELAALSEAIDFLGLKEIGGDNLGPGVEFLQKLGEIGAGKPWCAATCNGCAEIAGAKKNVRSPLEDVPLQGFVQAYYEHAVSANWIVPWADVSPGCLFLLYFPRLTRYAHMGFVRDLQDDSYTTIEGNSNDDGSRNGWGMVSRLRKPNDRTIFLHWSEGL